MNIHLLSPLFCLLTPSLLHSSFSSPDDYIVPEKASCLGCPEDIDENSEDLKGPLSASVSKYNSMSDSTHLFTLHTVGPATRQVETGWYEERGKGEECQVEKSSVSFPPTVCMFPRRWSQVSGSSCDLIWGRPPAPRPNTKTWTICVSLMNRIW